MRGEAGESQSAFARVPNAQGFLQRMILRQFSFCIGQALGPENRDTQTDGALTFTHSRQSQGLLRGPESLLERPGDKGWDVVTRGGIDARADQSVSYALRELLLIITGSR